MENQNNLGNTGKSVRPTSETEQLINEPPNATTPVQPNSVRVLVGPPKESKVHEHNPRVVWFRKFLGLHELHDPDTYRALLGEVYSMFFLIVLGVGAGVACELYSFLSTVGPVIGIMSAAFLINAIIWITAHVSGAHFNPAITLAFLCTGRLSLTKSVLYIIAQFVGAIAGAYYLYMLIPSRYFTELHGRFSTALRAPDISPWQAVAWEMTGTAFLLNIYFASITPGRPDVYGVYALEAGLTAASILWGIAFFSGGSLNPARTFATALVSGKWDDHWIYWLGPLVGGPVGAAFHYFILARSWAPWFRKRNTPEAPSVNANGGGEDVEMR